MVNPIPSERGVDEYHNCAPVFVVLRSTNAPYYISVEHDAILMTHRYFACCDLSYNSCFHATHTQSLQSAQLNCKVACQSHVRN